MSLESLSQYFRRQPNSGDGGRFSLIFLASLLERSIKQDLGVGCRVVIRSTRVVIEVPDQPTAQALQLRYGQLLGITASSGLLKDRKVVVRVRPH